MKKHQWKWGLLLCALSSGLCHRAYADNTMSSILVRFQDDDPDVRSVAFSSAIARPAGEKQAAYQNALIRLLATEITYSSTTPVAELQDDDEWNDYFKRLIITVAQLRNPNSIPELLQVIDKGDEVTQSLAGFGPSILDRIIPKTNDSNPAIRLGAVTVLFDMLEPENEIRITDMPTKIRMEAALKKHERDSDPNIRSTVDEALKKLETLKKKPESLGY